MEQNSIYQWARAVLSPKFLSLMPCDTDCASLLTEVTSELNLKANFTTDFNCPVLEGEWKDILSAQVKLVRILNKWQKDKENTNKINLASDSNEDISVNCKNKTSNLGNGIIDDVSVKNNIVTSSDKHILPSLTVSKIDNDKILNNEKHINKTSNQSETLLHQGSISNDLRNVFVISSSNSCNDFSLIPSTCHVQSQCSTNTKSVNFEQDVIKSSEHVHSEQITMSIGDTSQVILVTATASIDDKVVNDIEEGELYMNILLAPKENYEDNIVLKDKLHKSKAANTSCRENPLKKLCQLLRINEEESGTETNCGEVTTNNSCDEVFKEFEKKRRYEENMPFKYFCNSCSFKTKRENQFLKHIKLHEQNRVLFRCDHCSFVTIRVATLNRHKLQHSEGHLMNCLKCPYKTDSLKYLKKHIQSKHSSNKPALSCCTCDFIAGSLRELRKHKHIFHNQSKRIAFLSCSLCSYKTKNRGHLQRHNNEVHELLRSYLCHHCGKSFKRHDTLKQHKIIHGETGQSYTCSHCNRACRSLTLLKKHMSVHSSQRPFLCELCGAKFKTRSSQTKHVKILHSVKKIVPCPVCKRTYSSKAAMVKHKKTHRIKENILSSTCETLTSVSSTSNVINDNTTINDANQQEIS